MKLAPYSFNNPTVSCHKGLYYIDWNTIEIHIKNKFSRTGECICFTKKAIFNYELYCHTLLFKKYLL